MVQYSQERDFLRGEVYMVNFPTEPVKFGQSPRLLEGLHRAVVLFDSTFPRKTVVVLPISSLYSDKGNEKETISTDVILKSRDYEGHTGEDTIYNNTIKKDSFIMTNQIRSISRNYLESQKGKLIPKDMVKLDIQLIEVLSLQDTIEQLVEDEVQKRLSDMGIEQSTD